MKTLIIASFASAALVSGVAFAETGANFDNETGVGSQILSEGSISSTGVASTFSNQSAPVDFIGADEGE